MCKLLMSMIVGIAFSFSHFSAMAESDIELPVKTSNQPYIKTSILQLISHPERFYNRNIQVGGYYLYDWLTLSLDHNLSSELRVQVEGDVPELTYSDCNEKWVELEGYYLEIFDQERRHTIGRIIADRLTLKESDEVCWQRTESYQYPLVIN